MRRRDILDFFIIGERIRFKLQSIIEAESEEHLVKVLLKEVTKPVEASVFVTAVKYEDIVKNEDEDKFRFFSYNFDLKREPEER